MKKLLLLLSALWCIGSAAQETYVFAHRDTCDLKLDIYRACEGSQTSFQGHPKPTVLYVFGGGFIMGERNQGYVRPWFKMLTENGYNVVSIDYRLGMKGYRMGRGLSSAFKASTQFLKAQQMGVEDLFSAIAYLGENDLGIDIGNLVVAGSSAGAIITMAAEYDILCGRAEGLPEGFNFKGLMSFAGAIISTGGAPHYPSAPCPMLILHGTADKAVTYNHFRAFGRGVWGSGYLTKQLKKKGYGNYCFYSFKDRTHDVAAYQQYVWDIQEAFLEQNVILGNSRTVEATVDDKSLPSWTQVNLNTIYKR